MTKYELGNILIYEQPTKYIVKSENYDDSFPVPVLTPGQTFILGYTAETEGVYSAPLPVIIFDDFTTATKLVNFPFKVKSSAMKILKPANENVFLPYWYYFLSSLKVDNGLHKRYWISVFANKQVFCPTLLEQKRIAGILDKVQSLIALQKQQLEKLDLLIKSKFIDMFGDPVTNPKNWPIRRMGDVFKITSGGTPSRKHIEYFENGTIPWVKTGDLKSQYLVDTEEHISELGLQNSSAKVFPQGTVLLAMYGATIGAASVLNIQAATNQACAAFLPTTDMLPEFLYMYLLLRKEHFISLGVGGAQPNISGEILKREKILCPSINEQRNFVKFSCVINRYKEYLQKRLIHLETLYKSLMQEYFG